ncbi:kynurenine formamidase isoform X2 [Bacillus rossius redtenbacheri]|uniref:kynurenine formamidase isoform X2 n=1 Tax=Bacillus rossius redtenbacheri TaxID=93214 RepID=UPI002FDD9BB9
MDDDELSIQYSPSKWSKRFHEPQEVINNHVRFVTEASERARRLVPCETGLKYGAQGGQLLDVFGGEALPGSPVFVYIHGGYWQELDREISGYCAQPLYEAGIKTVVVGYDLAPRVKLHTIVEEIQEAATFVLKYAKESGSSSGQGRQSPELHHWVRRRVGRARGGLLRRCVVFGGHSAGAHLSALLLDGPWWRSLPPHLRRAVGGFALLSGVFDLAPIVRTYVNDALELSEQDAGLLSPLRLEKEQPLQGLPRVLLAAAQHDSPAFLKQSEQYAQKLRQENHDVEFIVVPGVDHFDLVENLADGNYILTQKLIKFINGLF